MQACRGGSTPVGMSRRPPAPALPKADRTAGIAALSAIGWIAVASAQSSDSGAKARSREPSGRTTRPRLERYSALRRALVLRAQGQAPEAVPIAQIALRADEQSNLSDPDSFGCLRKSKQHEYASQRAITLKPWPRSPPARLSADRLGARVTQLRRRDRNPAGGGHRGDPCVRSRLGPRRCWRTTAHANGDEPSRHACHQIRRCPGSELIDRVVGPLIRRRYGACSQRPRPRCRSTLTSPRP